MHKYEDISAWDNKIGVESLGGKDKFWLRDIGGIRWLFKVGRDDHENWSEVLAADICEKLRIPHAEYKLAIYKGQKGVVSKDFVRLSSQGNLRDATFQDSTYLLRNFTRAVSEVPADFLWPIITVPEWVKQVEQMRNQLMRNIEVASFVVWVHKKEAESGNADFLIKDPDFPKLRHSLAHYFVGYLMLDALIANRDRHQENWGYIAVSDGSKYCAPTYDHASSFVKESDDKKQGIMENRKGFNLQGFCRRARTPFVNFAEVKLTTLQVFSLVNLYFPQEATYWRGRLNRCSVEKFLAPLVNKFANNVMSPITKEFVIEMLKINRDRILYL